MKINDRQQKYKMLSQDLLKSILDYNPETGEFIWLVRRGRCAAGSVAGSIRVRKDRNLLLRYLSIRIDGVLYPAHHVAFIYMTGTSPTLIDHKDSNGLNNRWLNLKESDSSLNVLESRYICKSKTGLVGVYVHGNKWQARVFKDKTMMILGDYGSPDEAYRARLNFIESSGTGARVVRPLDVSELEEHVGAIPIVVPRTAVGQDELSRPTVAVVKLSTPLSFDKATHVETRRDVESVSFLNELPSGSISGGWLR
jgi:hypothetical protein